jgi:hypothetical protein
MQGGRPIAAETKGVRQPDTWQISAIFAIAGEGRAMLRAARTEDYVVTAARQSYGESGAPRARA